MSEIKEIFADAEEKVSKEAAGEIEILLEHLEGFNFETDVSEERRSSVYYYAGYASRGLLHRRRIKCKDCVEMIAQGNEFDEKSTDEEFCALASRGGLCHASDIMFMTCLHAFTLWCHIKEQSETYACLMSSHNPRNTFSACFVRKMTELDSTSSIVDAKCDKKHPFKTHLQTIASTVFNCIAVNLCRETSSQIHEAKKKKQISEKRRKKDP